jgi:hypothetical protein
MKRTLGVTVVLATGSVGACSEAPLAPEPEIAVQFHTSRSEPRWRPDRRVQAEAEAAVRAFGMELGETYRARGAMPLKAVWIAAPGGQAMGTEVLFMDVGDKQIGAKYVPGDPRRQGRTDIRYGVVPSAPAGMTMAQAEAAIDRAMSTWDNQKCSTGLDIGKVSYLSLTADIVHFGWTPLPPPVLGLTIPFIWVDSDDNPTDIDHDGAFDYAFALISYSSNYSWAIDDNIDVESIALHEAGHGLGQAHFGRLFQTLRNGQYHFGPRAVMNAGYTGPQQALTGTDEAGHCSLWGSWPVN